MFTPFFSKLALQNTYYLLVFIFGDDRGSVKMLRIRTPRMKNEFYVRGIAQAREFIN